MLTTKSVQVFDQNAIKPGSFITFRFMDYEYDETDENNLIMYPIVDKEVNGIIEDISETQLKVWSLDQIHYISINQVTGEHPKVLITGIQPKVDWD